MTQDRKTVLVTGGRGFIGRKCLPLLVARGFEVHATTASATGEANAVWHHCDLLDRRASEALVNRLRPTHLLHLAWIARPGVFWSSPENLDWLAGSALLADKFYGAGGLRALGVGSCAEYGMSRVPCQETGTLAPETVYGEAKTAMYYALRAAARGRGNWIWARLFFPYGPGEPAGRFIPSVIDALTRRVALDCTHGMQVRDFIYVDDVAEACVALLDSELEGAYNIGTGRETSLRDVARLIVEMLGNEDLLRFGAREAPVHEPAYLVADVHRLFGDLGWAPRVTLEEGLRRTIAARNSATEGVS